MKGIRMLGILIIPPLLISGSALLLLRMPLPQPFPPASSAARNLLAAILTGVCGFIYLISITVYIVLSFFQASEIPGKLCETYGLTEQSHTLWGQQCRGHIQERAVTLYFKIGRGVKSPVLDVYVEADVETRIAFVKRGPRLDCAQCESVSIPGEALNTVHIFAEEPDRARAWLADDTVPMLVGELLQGSEQFGSRELYLQPDRIWLRAHLSSQVTESTVEQWLQSLLKLAAGKKNSINHQQ